MTGEISTNENFFTWLFISATIIASMLIFFFMFVNSYYDDKKRKEGIGSETLLRQMCFKKAYEFSQMVFEIVISNTCIIVMMSVYYWIERDVVFLHDYLNIVILVLILLAITVNKLIDCILGQDFLSETNRSNIRLLSSCSIICIFLFLKFFCQINEYDELIVSYVCLVFGRFIFFDSTWGQIKAITVSLKYYIVPLIIELILMCTVGGIGIHLNVITEKNVLISLLVLHIVMVLGIRFAKKAVFGSRSIRTIINLEE